MASFALSLAVGLATNYVISLLTPSTERRVEQNQRDIRGPKTGFDQPIAKIYGEARVGCGYLWATPVRVVTIEETETSGGGGKGESRSGKGGGGSSVTTTTIRYEYYADFAFWICESRVSLRRVWMNGDVVWVSGGNKKIGLTQYSGSESQTADSTIQSVEGSANTPDFKGLAYAVAENALLNDFNSSFPQVIEAEVRALDFENPTLQEIIEDVCDRAGLSPSEYDASELSDINVVGAILKNDGSTYRNFLEELQQAYFFLPIYSDGVIKFINQKQPNTATLTRGDLSPKGWNMVYASRQDVPYEIQLTYYNRSDSYQRGVQYSRRQGRRTNTLRIETSLTLYDGKARSICNQLQTQFWIQRKEFEEIKLLPAWLGLEPGNVITLPNNQQFQISELDIGANLSIEIKGKQYRSRGLEITDDTPTSEGDYEYRPPSDPVDLETAEVIPFEAPIRASGDPETCIYAAIKAPPELIAGMLMVSENDADYRPAKELGSRSTIGTAETDISSTILPNQWDGSDLIDDTTIIRIVLEQGELNSVPQSDFEDNKRVLLIGDEYVGFRDATLVAEKTYDVSYLKRGLRGTERAIAQHTTNERAILMRGETGNKTLALQGTVDEIGKTLYFKAVAPRQDPDAIVPASITVQGTSLKPFAPVNVKMFLNTIDGGLKFTWEARSRGVEYDLGEQQESYELDIYDGGSVVRTITSNNKEGLYAGYEQEADLGARTNLLEEIRLYKVSSIVGRGFPAVVTNLQVTIADSSSGGVNYYVPPLPPSISDVTSGGVGVEANAVAGVNPVRDSSTGGIGSGGISGDQVVTPITESSIGGIGSGGSSNDQIFDPNATYIYWVADGELKKVDTNSQAIVWSDSHTSISNDSISAKDNVIYSADEEFLLALNPDGTTLWSLNSTVSFTDLKADNAGGSYSTDTSGSIIKRDSSGSQVSLSTPDSASALLGVGIYKSNDVFVIDDSSRLRKIGTGLAEEWNITLPDTARDIAVAEDQDSSFPNVPAIYIVDSPDWVSGGNNDEGYARKYDFEGNEVWSVNTNVTPSDLVEVDSSGEYLYVGSTIESTLIKLDTADGSEIWREQYFVSTDNLSGIAVDETNGFVYVATRSQSDWSLRRYNISDGSKDTNFAVDVTGSSNVGIGSPIAFANF